MDTAHDALLKQLDFLSTTCGMNQRYAQYMMGSWESLGTFIDVAVVVTTMLALALGTAAYYKPDQEWPVFPWWGRTNGFHWARFRADKLSAATAIAAAIAGVLLIVVPVGGAIQHYSNMFQSWSALRQDVDSVIIDARFAAEKKGKVQDDSEYLVRRYRELLAKKNQLNAREPAPDVQLLEECLLAEERSRGVEDEAKANTSPPKASPTAVLDGGGI